MNTSTPSRLLAITLCAFAIIGTERYLISSDKYNSIYRKGTPDIARLVSEGWFGSYSKPEEKSGEQISPDDEFEQALQTFSDALLRDLVISYLIIDDLDDQPIIYYLDSPERYSLVLKRNESTGRLVKDLFLYLGVICYLPYASEVELIRNQIIAEEIPEDAAQLRLLEIDFKTLEKIREFDDEFFQVWCQKRGIDWSNVERGYPEGDFESWMKSEWVESRKERRVLDFKLWRSSGN